MSSSQIPDEPMEIPADGRSSSASKDSTLEAMLKDSTTGPGTITKDFSENQPIGAGGFGQVYKGVLGNEVIAVKKLLIVRQDVYDKPFENEVSCLTKLKHKNIVKFVGYCSEKQKRSELYYGYLHDRSHAKYHSDESSLLDWQTRYNIIRGICDGLKYIHENIHDKPHLDLKPANILLDESMMPKLSDFGLSRTIDKETAHASRNYEGTLGYMAPEYFEKGEISTKCDIFSLGVIITEILSGHRGYSKYLTMSTDGFIDHVQKYSRNKLQEICDIESMIGKSYGQVAKCIDIVLKCITVAASAKGGTEIKIGPHVIHVPKYSSVHHPLVQMVLFAWNKFDDTLACLKSMAPKPVSGIAERLCSSAWTIVYESLKKRKASGFDTTESIGRRKEPIGKQSHHSDPDSSRAELGIEAMDRKAPAPWVVATGAPHHATGDRGRLSGFTSEHNDQFVHAVDGVPMKVLARGAVVEDAFVIPDVWFVPGLTVNLVSVRQLAELGYTIGFGCGECCISAAGKVVGKAHLQEGGLYVLDFLKIPLAI